LGAVTARLFGVDRILFFENGVVSLNLPPVAQVVGARATRTTHPQALAGFRRVLAALLGRPFEVANPFMWLTKAEAVERIAAHGFADLIPDTRSCARVHGMTILHPHCGECSQCLDRRFAILAAGQGQHDPGEAYRVDLFTGERRAGPDREMALAYVRSASDVNRMADVAFFSRYGEASRAVAFFPEPAGAVAERILDLHRRHAAAVCTVFDRVASTRLGALRERTLPASCLLSLVLGQGEHKAGPAYPPRDEERKESAHSLAQGAHRQARYSSHQEIRMAIDVDRRRLVFDRWGAIEGTAAELLMVLAEAHQRAMSQGLLPERYPFTPTARLLERLRADSAETLRRRVLRCRNAIARLARRASDASLSMDAVIESNQWHGYRLNPDAVRLVAITELTDGGSMSDGRPIRKRGHLPSFRDR
jgi:hypothetical protein